MREEVHRHRRRLQVRTRPRHLGVSFLRRGVERGGKNGTGRQAFGGGVWIMHNFGARMEVVCMYSSAGDWQMRWTISESGTYLLLYVWQMVRGLPHRLVLGDTMYVRVFDSTRGWMMDKLCLRRDKTNARKVVGLYPALCCCCRRWSHTQK